MSFFKKKKPIVIQTMTASSLIRKIIYDSGCQDPETVAELMGLNRVSDDVAEMEIEDSDMRLDRLVPILPIVESHASISAQISVLSYLHSTTEEGEEFPDKDVVDALVVMFKGVALTAAVSCLSAMIDLNLIKEEY